MSARVLVAMSGGVDSSVAAALLCEQGYEVVGVAMRLVPEAPAYGEGRRASCCSHDDFEDARRVAERMGFPFYVVDLRNEFASGVMADFVAQYLSGRTPNPCVTCNERIKFDRLWQRAKALQCDLVATGHYARVERDEHGCYHLLRAADTAKDQSYFLFMLGQEELSRTRFPLGNMTKSEVRAKARALGLVNADKAESQEICFIPDGNYARFIERMAEPGRIRRGRIVSLDGQPLAQHGGIHRFTVGQRRGLGVARGEALYVSEIDPERAEVRVARKKDLRARGLHASAVRFVHPDFAAQRMAEIEVKIRYRHPLVPARLTLAEPERAEVLFLNGAPAVTPGQACVFYRRDEVLGGGLIERAL